MNRLPSAKAAWLLLLMAALLRLGAAFSFPVYPLVDNTADTAIYDEGARSLAAGEGYLWQGKPTAFFPVGWPLLLSFAYRAGGVSERSGHLLNVMMSLLLLVASWKCAERLAGPAAGLLTLAILAFAPHQVVYPAFLMSETAFTAFFMLSLWLLSRGTASMATLVPAGLAMGAATLIRGPALVLPLFVILWARFGERRSLPASVGAAFVFGLAMLVPILPWGARNHQVFGRWVMVANDGGMNFLMGNHRGATGARHEPEEGLPDFGDEVKDDREGYRRGLEFIRTHPGEFLALLPKKFVRLVAAGPLLTYRAELLAKWPKILAYALLGLDQLLHLALWGFGLLAVLRRSRGSPVSPRPDAPLRTAAPGAHPVGAGAPARAVVFVTAALAVWIAIHLVFLGGARYFFPMTPALAILAAAGWAGRAVMRTDAVAGISGSGT